MAKLQCTECGMFVSDDVDVCPHCGASLDTYAARGRRIGKNIVSWVYVIALLAIVVPALISCLYNLFHLGQ